MKIRGLFFVLLATSAVAQLESASIIRHMRVRISLANGACDYTVRVRLAGQGGTAAEANANPNCEVDFANIPEGTYHLTVSGPGFATTDQIVQASQSTDDFEVRINRPSDAASAGTLVRTIPAAELSIPPKAHKEFDKAQALIDRGEYSDAIRSLKQAIAIYPRYAGAYNNLGVAYARLGDRDKEREALQQAIGINDHFAAAYVNLGRMDITGGDFAGAQAELTKAISYDPANSIGFELLTYAEFMDHHNDLAIATSQRAHSLQGTHAFAHQVAARAYEQKRDGVNAIAELELFLKEEPSGERAAAARKELAQVQAIVRQSAIQGQ